MKRTKNPASDEIRPEYDFASMKGGVRGKYVKRYQAGTNLALLDPDVARAFPSDEAVNRALRAVLTLSDALERPRRKPRSSAATSGSAAAPSRRP